MAEQQVRLNREDLSSVWKDGGNVRWGLKLDLVNHLKQQREMPAWVKLKKEMLDKIEGLIPKDRAVQVMEIGCGLGIDVLDVAVRIAEVNKHPGSRVVGVDFNTEMIMYCKGALQDRLSANPQSLPDPSHVSIEFIQDDATQLSSVDLFAPSSSSVLFDLVRSDIALQHMNPIQCISAVHKVLREDTGVYIYLEGAAGAGFFSTDEFVNKIYKSVIPALPDGGPGVKAFFELKKQGFSTISFDYHGISQQGHELKAADPSWIKLEGMCKMVVEKNLMTKEDSEEYLRRYKCVVEENNVLILGACALVVARKNK